MMLFLFFLNGTIIGSFLNVVIYRFQQEETLGGRSHCRACKKTIAWHDNIPVVSFAVLKGKCRHCGESISWQYPLVELATGAVFVSVGALFFSPSDWLGWGTTVFYLGLFSILIVIFVHDLQTMYIPMNAVWAGILWTVLFLLFLPRNFPVGARLDFFSWDWFFSSVSGMVPFLLSGIGAFLFFGSLVWVSGETWMGMGDAYVALLIGLAAGWPLVLLSLTLSFALGAGIGSILLLLGKKGRKSHIPFAPFLVSGVYIMILTSKVFPEITGFFTW